jgi:predicted lipoprotein with Yx(FWY)xxD motif
MVLCTDACATIWDPLTVSGEQPTAGDGLAGKLGVAERPDGAEQVTFDGRLLYRFVERGTGPSARTAKPCSAGQSVGHHERCQVIEASTA